MLSGIQTLDGPDQPVQPGLVAPDVVDDEERREPVLGLEGCPLSEVTGTGPNACEGKICQSININTANIDNIKLNSYKSTGYQHQQLIIYTLISIVNYII